MKLDREERGKKQKGFENSIGPIVKDLRQICRAFKNWCSNAAPFLCAFMKPSSAWVRAGSVAHPRHLGLPGIHQETDPATPRILMTVELLLCQ